MGSHLLDLLRSYLGEAVVDLLGRDDLTAGQQGRSESVILGRGTFEGHATRADGIVAGPSEFGLGGAFLHDPDALPKDQPEGLLHLFPIEPKGNLEGPAIRVP